MAGRKPKPTVVKRLEGNPGRRPLNDDEPQPAESLSLDAPSYLDDCAAGEWRRLAEELQSQNLLTSWDEAVFASYCQCFSQWREASTMLEYQGSIMQTDKGYRQVDPLVAIVKQSRSDMNKYGSLLGLNPAERSRLHVAGASKDGGSDEAYSFFGY